MERLNHPPFPEIEGFRKVIPATGIALHGTSFENAQNILKNGFSIGFWGVTDRLHYYYIAPEGIFENSQKTKAEYSFVVSDTFDKGLAHTSKGQRNPVLIVFTPHITSQTTLPHCEPEIRVQTGLPVHCVTKSARKIKVLGSVEFALRDGKWFTDNTGGQTLENITNFLRNLSEPQPPAQE